MTPILQTLWMADAVEYDPDTGRATLRGIFNTIRVDEGAEFAAGGCVFFAIRGVHGQVRLTLRYVDLRDERQLLTRPVRVDGTPLETIDFTVRVNQIPVPHAGVFAWELLLGDEMLGVTRVEVFVN